MCIYRTSRRSLPRMVATIAALAVGYGPTEGEGQSPAPGLSARSPISIAVSEDVVTWAYRDGARVSVFSAGRPEYGPSRLSVSTLIDPVSLGPTAGMLSPDGSWILYLRDGLLYRLPASGTVAEGAIDESPLFTTIGLITDAVWSPDGTRIAFVMAAPRARRLAAAEASVVPAFVGVFDLESGRRWFLSPSLRRDASPVWSPDGGEIFFQRRAVASSVPSAGARSGAAAWRVEDAAGSALMVGEVESGAVRTVWSDAGDDVVLIGAGGSPAPAASAVGYPVAPPLATWTR